MEIIFDKFNEYHKKLKELKPIDDIISIDKLRTYRSGKLPKLTKKESNEINNFIFSNTELNSEDRHKAFLDIRNEIKLNVVNIPNNNQLERYLKYIQTEFDTVLSWKQNGNYYKFIKEGKINYTDSIEVYDGKYVIGFDPINIDPISNLLNEYERIYFVYEDAIEFATQVAIDNGFVQGNNIASNLVFKGSAAEFTELMTALFESGQIQRTDGSELHKNELQKAFRQLLNLNTGYDDKTLSSRLSGKKTAQEKASYLKKLTKIFENYINQLN